MEDTSVAWPSHKSNPKSPHIYRNTWLSRKPTIHQSQSSISALASSPYPRK